MYNILDQWLSLCCRCVDVLKNSKNRYEVHSQSHLLLYIYSRNSYNKAIKIKMQTFVLYSRKNKLILNLEQVHYKKFENIIRY